MNRRIPLIICTILNIIATIVVALSEQDLVQVFGSDSLETLCGQTLDVEHGTVSLISNTSHALVVYNITNTAFQDVGYMGFGFGTKMGDSDLIIAWPNTTENDWIVSHRLSPKGDYEPFPVDLFYENVTWLPFSVMKEGSLATDLTSNDQSPFTVFSILRPLVYPFPLNELRHLELAPLQSIIYAYASRPPIVNNSKLGPTRSTLYKHEASDSGNLTFDLSRRYLATPPTFEPTLPRSIPDHSWPSSSLISTTQIETFTSHEIPLATPVVGDVDISVGDVHFVNKNGTTNIDIENILRWLSDKFDSLFRTRRHARDLSVP